MPQQNNITITGDGNIILQDVNGGAIQLNASDPAILTQLEALQNNNAAAFQSLLEAINKRQEPVYQHLKNALINSQVFAQSVHIGDIYNLPPTPKLPKDLTLNIPKLHPDEVIGREADLQELHTLLFDNKRVVVVNGLGGIGKTTLAQVYVGQYYTSYYHVVWLSQLSENLLNDTINAEGLTKQLDINTQGQEPQSIFLEIISKLKGITDTPNLLIIDNADATLTQLYDRLPTQPDWHVLITSREKIERFYTKNLDFLSPEKALKLFRKHCTRITDEAAIQTILKTIDYHTLTIEILAKTAQKQRTPIAELQTALEHDLKANVYIHHKGDKIDKVRTYLASIFDFSQTTPDEQWLLKRFVCLPSEYHTYELLNELFSKPKEKKRSIFKRIFTKKQEETFNLPETLEELVAKGWLLHNPATDSYKMHRIIAEVGSEKLELTLAEVEPLIKMVTEKLELDQTKDNPVDKFPWISFGNSILMHFESAQTEQVARLQNGLAIILNQLGDYQAAKANYAKALVFFEKEFGENHSNTAVLYSNLALVLQDLGDYEGAKGLLEKALASDEQNFEAKHPRMATTYSNLAMVLKDLGDYAGAKKLLEKALRLNEANFDEKHPITAIQYSNLASVLQDLGDYKEAKINFTKALSIFEKELGENNPKTTQNYSNLALVLKDLGDYEEAKGLLEKALVLAERNYGIEHPQTVIYYSNLALVLAALGDYEGAKGLLEKTINLMEQNFGLNYPKTAQNYSNFAVVLQNLGDYEEAKGLVEKALALDEQSFGDNHPKTALRYWILATVHYHLKDLATALSLLQKAYTIYYSKLGVQHPHTKRIKESLEFVLQASQNTK